MQSLNTKYETIGAIIEHIKSLTYLTDTKKVEAVEILEELQDEDIDYIYLEKDVDWLMLELFGSVKDEEL